MRRHAAHTTNPAATLRQTRWVRSGWAEDSKGMRQNVLLSAARLHNPDLLILDEPLSGLDVNTALVLRELVAGPGRPRLGVVARGVSRRSAVGRSRLWPAAAIVNKGYQTCPNIALAPPLMAATWPAHAASGAPPE